MQRNTLDALLLLSEIETLSVHELANQYWPNVDEYSVIRQQNPWWLVLTKFGPIVIGNRKKVISINWSGTTLRSKVTDDENVTSELDFCHAWSLDKAVKYLTTLRKSLNAKIPNKKCDNLQWIGMQKIEARSFAADEYLNIVNSSVKD